MDVAAVRLGSNVFASVDTVTKPMPADMAARNLPSMRHWQHSVLSGAGGQAAPLGCLIRGRYTMQASHERVASHPRYHHNDLVETLSSLLPAWTGNIETVALGVLVCAFWGLILYAALAFGLR